MSRHYGYIRFGIDFPDFIGQDNAVHAAFQVDVKKIHTPSFCVFEQ
jgi:hypothetical protein